jgi:hypothetical protein
MLTRSLINKVISYKTEFVEFAWNVKMISRNSRQSFVYALSLILPILSAYKNGLLIKHKQANLII